MTNHQKMQKRALQTKFTVKNSSTLLIFPLKAASVRFK